tara:strand:+ start:436 stop:828 length:393 start_codon:yes stop_codon:yes gene_type:complete
MRPNMNLTKTFETWPGIDGWMMKKPLGMKSLMGLTSERYYSKSMLIREIRDRMSPYFEESIAKGLPIDMLHDFKIHFKGLFRIRYRGKSDYRKRYFREPNHCLQRYATSFAIYPIESKWDEIYKTIIGEK